MVYVLVSLAILFGILLLLVLGYLLQAIAYRKIFIKAGETVAWKAFVPIYNTYMQYSLTWDSLWFWVGAACMILSLAFSGLRGVLAILRILASLGSLVIRALNCYNLSLAFGHDIACAFGLFFLGPIFLLVIGFDSSEYQGPQDAVPLMDYFHKLEAAVKSYRK